MENQIVIKVENIGKKYNIKHQQGGYVALRDVLANVLKSPFAFLKQKTKEVAGIATKEEFWALRNINFEVKKGEVIGIIGRNGAGKSTLLKILSQITPPTEGEIKINGRVGSLLEVGTGFHPELSGRENIFLNGAILGMTRKEIAKKFDAIVAFSGIEKFLDTPVKRYSSGMYVRLAFSVAAHMDPDVLIVDEVLAVGDAEFQKKCLGKMDEITKKEGRTILFVSHNLGAIQQLCNKSILLKDGSIQAFGNTNEIISIYADQTKKKLCNKKEWIGNQRPGETEYVKFNSVKITDEKEIPIEPFSAEDKIMVTIEYEILKPLKGGQIGFQLKSENGTIVFESSDIPLPEESRKVRLKGVYKSKCLIPANLLNRGIYSISLCGHIPNQKILVYEENVIYIDIVTKNILSGTESQPGVIRPKLEWQIMQL